MFQYLRNSYLRRTKLPILRNKVKAYIADFANFKYGKKKKKRKKTITSVAESKLTKNLEQNENTKISVD